MVLIDEQNQYHYVNDDVNGYEFETNEHTGFEYGAKAQKKVSGKLQSKTLTAIVFLCAAVLFVGIYVPVFSEILMPSTFSDEGAYISGVKIQTNSDSAYKYLQIQVSVNENFKNFNSIYFELYNLTTLSTYSEYSITDKAYLASSWANIPFKLGEPVCDYMLRIYCSTDSPDDIEYSNSFVKDEVKYYLIYTHPEPISI